MPNLTEQEKVELINWYRALEDNESYEVKNLQQIEAFWKQNQDYYQDRYLYSDRI